MSLTDAGEQFLIHAQRITGAANQLSNLMNKHSLLAGNLKIGVPWIAGYIDVFKLLKCFQTAMPGIQYQLSVESSDELIWQLDRRSLHAVFVIRSQEVLDNRPNLYSHKIAQEVYEAWVPFRFLSLKKKILPLMISTTRTSLCPQRKAYSRARLERFLKRAERSRTSYVRQA